MGFYSHIELSDLFEKKFCSSVFFCLLCPLNPSKNLSKLLPTVLLASHLHRWNACLPMNTQLHPGDSAPDFTAIAISGSFVEAHSISLSSLRGKFVVLYFYPRDATPGCTAQACGVRDRYAEILAKDAVIFGISIDSPKSHADFLSKHSLPFPLICDESRTIVESYGVWVQKSMYGKRYMGTERTTFVIDPAGKIRAILRKIAPSAHMDAVLQCL